MIQPYSTIKPGYEHSFKNPIEAALAMFSMGFGEIIAMEINRYENKIYRVKKGKRNLFQFTSGNLSP
jgi:hypothetical protein